MKTYYELLGVAPTAEPEEIKRAFRREIARYHPDKVQHLGPEFQEIASTRAASLTEAYRILMDVETRRRYDDGLDQGLPDPEPPRPAPSAPGAATSARPPVEKPAEPVVDLHREVPTQDRRFAREQATMSDFVRRAVIAKLKEVVGAAGGTQVAAPAFDAVWHIKGRKPLFKKAEPNVRLVVRMVQAVDTAAIEDAWVAASRLPPSTDITCLMLLASSIAPARELAGAVSELRRKTRSVPPTVIPVDVRDWAALLPPETPQVLRSILDQLRHGS